MIKVIHPKWNRELQKYDGTIEQEIKDLFGQELNIGDTVIYAPKSVFNGGPQLGKIVLHMFKLYNYETRVQELKEFPAVRLKNGHFRRLDSSRYIKYNEVHL